MLWIRRKNKVQVAEYIYSVTRVRKQVLDMVKCDCGTYRASLADLAVDEPRDDAL